LNAIFVSLYLNCFAQLVRSLLLAHGERLSRQQLKGGHVLVLLEWFTQLQDKARERIGALLSRSPQPSSSGRDQRVPPQASAHA
jgi:hypothetical protein